MKTAVITLGHYGDILGILPWLWRSAQTGNRMTLCVNHEHAGLMDGIGYADCIVYNGDYGDVSGAVRFCQQNGFTDIRVAQCHGNPAFTTPQCPSYAMESWRLAGALNEFGRWPLVIDNRDRDRETHLLWQVSFDKPLILVGVNGISSPFAHGRDLLAAITAEFEDSHTIVDLGCYKADRIYDFLGMFEAADCLVSTDTVWLHLARAAKVPVVALLNDSMNGWRGSVPPPSTVFAMRYGEYAPQAIISAIYCAVKPEAPSRVLHVVDLFGQEPRHLAAQNKWDELYRTGVTPAWQTKDSVRGLLNIEFDDSDILLVTNDDNYFDAELLPQVIRHVSIYGACSIRRMENGTDIGHCGRDAFVMTGLWLNRHWKEIPDLRLGEAVWDLALAAIIRKSYGINTCMDNLALDLFPAELPPGLVLHEPHPSTWCNGSEGSEANRAELRKWCAQVGMEAFV